MKVTGIIRKLDDLGRVVLPIEFRRTLDIAERDELEISLENGQIILRKYEPACIFCASARKLISHNGRNVCRDCIRKNGRTVKQTPECSRIQGFCVI